MLVVLAWFVVIELPGGGINQSDCEVSMPVTSPVVTSWKQALGGNKKLQVRGKDVGKVAQMTELGARVVTVTVCRVLLGPHVFTVDTKQPPSLFTESLEQTRQA